MTDKLAKWADFFNQASNPELVANVAKYRTLAMTAQITRYTLKLAKALKTKGTAKASCEQIVKEMGASAVQIGTQEILEPLRGKVCDHLD